MAEIKIPGQARNKVIGASGDPKNSIAQSNAHPGPPSGVKSGYVAIIGRPNAGKSTLVNTILESEISIVTPKAQTTRDQVLGILTENRGQMIFIDTPGIHRAKEGGLNACM